MEEGKYIRNLVKEDRLEEALMKLEEMIDGTELMNELTLQYARYSSLRKDVNSSIIDHNDANIRHNQIIKSILHLLTSIENENNKKSVNEKLNYESIEFIRGATKGFLLEFGRLRLCDVEKLINLTIRLGAPRYNESKISECSIIYLTSAKLIYEFIQLEGLFDEWDAHDEMVLPLSSQEPKKGFEKYAYSLIKQDLKKSISICTDEKVNKSEKDIAWTLRYSFNRILIVISLCEHFAIYRFWENKTLVKEIVECLINLFEIEKNEFIFSKRSFYAAAVAYQYLIDIIQKMENRQLYCLSIHYNREYIHILNQSSHEEFTKIRQQLTNIIDCSNTP